MPEPTPAPRTDALAGVEILDGPWSLADAPADAAFIDFGALRIGSVPGLQLRPEFDPTSKACGAVSVRSGDVQVQLQVVAAPRGDGRWTTLRREMTDRLRREGSHVEAQEGRFGPELSVLREHTASDGATHAIPMRVQGVDGDRWLLKATSIGPSVDSEDTRAKVDALISRCAVDRGPGAAVPGTVLRLTVPEGAPAPGRSPGGRA